MKYVTVTDIDGNEITVPLWAELTVDGLVVFEDDPADYWKQ